VRLTQQVPAESHGGTDFAGTFGARLLVLRPPETKVRDLEDMTHLRAKDTVG
jgi:hypothetical protein